MIALVAGIGGLIVFGVLAALVLNGLVSSRNQVDNGWAQIDVQLTRRRDLIPNLVQTVKGYAAHESGTLEAVIVARNAAGGATGVAGKAEAENVLTGTLKSLFALAEAYPDLKANQNFLALQEELSSTENRIAFARQFYNDVVTRYDTRIQTFPGMLVARIGNFSPRETFVAEPESRTAPQVAF
jgi:LemA protein